MSLRVGLDVRTILFTRAGISRYVAGLLDGLRRAEGVEVAPLTVARPLRPFWSPRLERWWEESWAPRRIARAGCDVVHGTRFWVPRVEGVRTVATVYDLSFEEVPEAYSPEARDYFSSRLREALDRAAVLVTTSESVKRALTTRHGVKAERVAVAPPGVPDGFTPPSGTTIQDGAPYVLAVGTMEPRKNYPCLVEALAFVRARRPHVRLVLAGRKDRGWPAVEEAIRRHAVASAVSVMEGLGDAELADLYRGASVVAVPSLDEGFGFAALEAMACGVPVVAADRGSLPEVLAGAGLLTAPEPAPLAGALLQVMEEGSRRSEMRTAGLARAAEFTWGRTADRMVAAYRQAVRA